MNGSDAGYTQFQQKGVSIETISYTESTLHIMGSKENNNTLVHCAVLMEYPQLMWVNSRIASLLVMGRYNSVLLPCLFSQLKKWVVVLTATFPYHDYNLS